MIEVLVFGTFLIIGIGYVIIGLQCKEQGLDFALKRVEFEARLQDPERLITYCEPKSQEGEK